MRERERVRKREREREGEGEGEGGSGRGRGRGRGREREGGGGRQHRELGGQMKASLPKCCVLILLFDYIFLTIQRGPTHHFI